MKQMRQKKKNIMSGIYLLPNLITTAALFCGINAIIQSLKGTDLPKAAYFILLAGIFDFLDGYVARASRTSSSFGMEYDSLSDVIAFGIAPASLFYSAFLINIKRVGTGVVFIYVACAALRLARFNSKIEGEEKIAFRGLPTTAAAGFLASFFLVLHKYPADAVHAFIPGIIVGISFLMVSSLKYPAVSAIRIWKKKPFFYLGLVIIVMGLVFFFKELSFFVICSGYVLFGIYKKMLDFKFFRKLMIQFKNIFHKGSVHEFSEHNENIEKEGE